jgi:glycosyltransferase involved in cell wall biosynthesis
MNEAALKRQAALQLGDDAVVFTGRVPHHAVFDYIQLMDIAVMPRSNWYGSPMKIFEYGILSKAVIAPDNGPVRDVMVHEQDGILIQPGTHSLTAALQRLLHDESLRKQLGDNFREKILAQYTWNKQAEFILSHCKSH